MQQKAKRIFLWYGIFLASVGGAVVILSISGIGCPIRLLFGIPCPTCGVTRAMMGLLCGDFAAYLHFHPLAVFLCSAVCLLPCLRFLKKKNLLWGYILSVTGVNFLFYLFRDKSILF